MEIDERIVFARGEVIRFLIFWAQQEKTVPYIDRSMWVLLFALEVWIYGGDRIDLCDFFGLFSEICEQI